MKLSPMSIVIAASAMLAAPPRPARALGDPAPEIAALRARGPAGLEALLADYDRAAPAAREALAPRIDAVAAQRYATVSRLYWYTDLARAQDAARTLHRPILALRMLGDLRDELSCANSRLFRATLYANADVSAFLRSHFVLYWSSERAAPRITIDFGDGRKIVRTTTGNSAHYVLDETGEVLDVLPGLYAPQAFKHELERSLALAGRVRGMTDRQRRAATVAYHRRAFDATFAAWNRIRGTQYIAGSRYLVTRTALARAQGATVAKAAMEVPDLQRIGAMAPEEAPHDAAVWSAVGQAVWGIEANAPRGPAADEGVALVPPAPSVLDAASIALVTRLHDAGGAPRATPAERAAMLARLEQHIVADTALNQFVLRQRIRSEITGRSLTDFAALNAWIYDQVFATPQSDPWLGLLPRTDFTGLPGDGVVTR